MVRRAQLGPPAGPLGQPIVLDCFPNAGDNAIKLLCFDGFRLSLQLLYLRGELCQRLRHVLS